MNGYLSKSARVIAVLVAVTMLLTALPSALPARAAGASTASAAAAEVRCGMLSEVQYWNPMNLYYAEDWISCYMIFSSLWTFDEDYEQYVGDLALDWSMTENPNGTMTLAVEITPNAYFRNIENPNDMTNKLTTWDVEYTIRAIQDNPGGNWDLYVQNITWINILSDTSMELITNEPIATLIWDLTQLPILPKFRWENKPGQFLAEPHDPTWLMGSGPFYVTEVESTYYRFVTAPNYHGAIDYPGVRDVNIGGVLFTIYGAPDGLVLAINSGTEDCADIRGALNLWLNSLGVGNPNVVKQATQEPGITDIAINAIPMDFRKPNYCDGNPLLLDWYVRQAISMTLNRDTICNVLMSGLVTPADSVHVPNWWKKNITLDPYDPALAKSVLEDHGYSDTDADGYLEATDQAYPYKQGWVDVGAELNFRLHATNNEPSYMAIGENWVDWAAQAGIRFDYEALPEWPTMTNEDWFKALYDVWVWHWGWVPEPLGNLATWLTKEIKTAGSNCQTPMGPWWFSAVNSTTGVAYSAYDENWTDARKIMNDLERRDMAFTLQQWIYDSRTEIPPFYDLGLYGYSTERFVGWGDWEAHPGRPPSYSGVEWLWFDLEPVANVAPVFNTGLSPDYTTVPLDIVTFQVDVSDSESDQLWLNWTYGDLSPVEGDILPAGTTSTPQTVTRTHSYAAEGDYPVVVTLTDGLSGHQKQSSGTVHVQPVPDAPPTILNPPEYSPAPPQYTMTTVDWWVNASDDDVAGADLLFTWVWGDGQMTVSPQPNPTPNDPVTDHQTHAWTAPDIYNVRVYVWDGVADPAHNQTSFTPYEIVEDTPPYNLVVSPISTTEGVWVECVATGVDDDPFDLRFTWEWDDGTYNVTDHANPLPGQDVTSTVYHTWATQGTYPVTVYLDDLTGWIGYNISATINADVQPAGVNVAPSALLLAITPADPAQRFVGVDLTFDPSAIDADGDAMTVYIEYGDGATAVDTTAGGTTARQHVDPLFTHAYSEARTCTVNVSFDDGQGHNVSMTQDVTILPVPVNEPPWLDIQTAYGASWNVSLTITPLRCLDNDTDTLDVWYDWGDGNWSQGDAGADYAGTHAYEMAPGEYTLTVWANDGQGHNVSKSATVIVTDNLKPTLVSVTKAPSKTEYNETEEITFTVVVKDYEGDQVNLTVEFGDGERAYSQFTPTANTNTTRTFTHTYGEGSGRIDPYRVNVTAKDDQMHYSMVWSTITTTVKVAEPAEEEPGEEEAFPWALVAGIAILLIIVIAVVAFLLMKRKKGGAEEKGAMEGMAPPPPPPT